MVVFDRNLQAFHRLLKKPSSWDAEAAEVEPTLGEEPGVPGPQGRQPGDGSAEMLGEGVFFGGDWREKLIFGLAYMGGTP